MLPQAPQGRLRWIQSVCQPRSTSKRSALVFVSLPASVASGERTFNVLNQVKNYHRSTMGQGRLNGLAMLNINYDIA